MCIANEKAPLRAAWKRPTERNAPTKLPWGSIPHISVLHLMSYSKKGEKSPLESFRRRYDANRAESLSTTQN